MTAFDDAINTVNDEIDSQGSTISYTPKGDAAQTINAVLGPLNPGLAVVASPSEALSLVIKYADVPTPKNGDTATFQEQVWYVVGNEGGGAQTGTWELVISRSSRRNI